MQNYVEESTKKEFWIQQFNHYDLVLVRGFED